MTTQQEIQHENLFFTAKQVEIKKPTFIGFLKGCLCMVAYCWLMIVVGKAIINSINHHPEYKITSAYINKNNQVILNGVSVDSSINQPSEQKITPASINQTNQEYPNENTIISPIDGKSYNLTQFIQEGENNEIKKINILYWKLKFIEKTNPNKQIHYNIDNIIEFTHKSYTQLHKYINKETNNQKTLNIDTKEWLTKFISNTNLNPIYTGFIDETLINSAITDKVAFANYLTNNKLDINNTENIFLNQYSNILK